jgi:Protein of unknown function (DUF2283)
VVVKIGATDAFVVTAYLTDKVKERKSAMARRKVRVWYDREGDYLEVMFDLETPGYFRDTQDDRVVEKVDAAGNVLGFSILRVSALRKTPLEVSL